MLEFSFSNRDANGQKLPGGLECSCWDQRFSHFLSKEISLVKSYLGAWGMGPEVVSKKKKKNVKVNVKKKCQWSKVTRGLGVLLLGSKRYDRLPARLCTTRRKRGNSKFLSRYFSFHLGRGGFYANSSYI